MPKRYLGLDFGLKRIGVAVGEDITHQAEPVTILKAQKGEPNWNELQKIIQTWKPVALIVGVPFNMDDTDSPRTTLARNFMEKLKQHYALPVHEIDERLTSRAARDYIIETQSFRALKNQALDSIAAKIILESWLSLPENQ